MIYSIIPKGATVYFQGHAHTLAQEVELPCSQVSEPPRAQPIIKPCRNSDKKRGRESVKSNLSLSLREPWQHGNGSLEELVDRATEIARLSEGEIDEKRWVKERNRMIRMVLRSACEAIIRLGRMPLPLGMNLFSVGQPVADRAKWVPIPPEYVALCAEHGVKPELAAVAALSIAARQNPACMRFVSARPLQRTEIMEEG